MHSRVVVVNDIILQRRVGGGDELGEKSFCNMQVSDERGGAGVTASMKTKTYGNPLLCYPSRQNDAIGTVPGRYSSEKS